ncbi:hypothetical protein Scep_029831 [Stephania cephalantha]|uniref:Uncharacterized protein n=1 Tax=Stephania cephalantha TaxID=152367 RepID=A0AAP0E1D5_9MAGN
MARRGLAAELQRRTDEWRDIGRRPQTHGSACGVRRFKIDGATASGGPAAAAADGDGRHTAARWRTGDAEVRGVVRRGPVGAGTTSRLRRGGRERERSRRGERDDGERREEPGVTGVRSGSERRSDGRRREVRE